MAVNTNQNLQHQVIYSVFVRNHTPEGTFRALERDLDRLRTLGTDIVWLMPIHPIGVEGRKGALGSPYAIRDYRAVDPDYGTLEDFTHLVDEIHRRGMKCIIDVVYNHTSPDSVLAQTHPEWFLRDGQGRPTRKVAEWWDIADLDYSVPALWTYQIDTLKQWAAIVDGFRCDVASSVPLDFWLKARQEVETVRPGCIWLAESVHIGYILQMRRMGQWAATDSDLHRAFDMTYDYDIWSCYEGYLLGKHPLSQLTDLMTYQELTYPEGYIKARCVENHDTERLASYLQTERQVRQWLAFLYLRRGAVMLYEGTEYAPCHRASLFDRDESYLEPRRDMTPLLQRLKAVKETLPLTGGVWYEAEGDAAIVHYDGSEGRLLGVFDLGAGDAASVAVDVPEGVYENLLGGSVTVQGGRLTVADTPVVIRY